MNKFFNLTIITFLFFTFFACTDNKSNKIINSIAIKGISIPTTISEKAKIRVTKEININGKNTSLSYKTILRTATSLSGETFGLLKDINNKALIEEDGSSYICNGQFGGSGPDHTEFIHKFGKIFMITQFECQIGAIYQAELEQNISTGSLRAKNLKFISQSSHYGGYVHCAGMKSPWNSFLGSEEYEPNAADINISTGSISPYYDFVAPYFGGDLTKANPYFYGWITEISIINKDGENKYFKHYSMGRFSHELAYVLPDRKTSYLSDDGTNDGFYMYIADRVNDLTSGTLYAAKWQQIDDKGAGKADISWIKLGHATDKEIKTIVDAKVSFLDIFDSEIPNANFTCPTLGFKSINTQNGLECLKVKAGKDKEAAFLESRRYAALRGATTEFRKMEGLTYNPQTNQMYLSISQISKGMEDFKNNNSQNNDYDKGSNNDIRLKYNMCGAIYALDLKKDIKDFNGDRINSNKVVINMNSLISGIPKNYDIKSIYANNSCDVNSISMPDNLTYKKDSNLLIIGEDTSYHQNDMVWAFDTKLKKLSSRIATTPFGSETTSLMFQDQINGYEYINFVTQHPYGESDKDKLKNPDDVESYVGYIQIGKKMNEK